MLIVVLKYKLLKAVAGHFSACRKYTVISQQTSEAVAQFLIVFSFLSTLIFKCVLVPKKFKQRREKSKERDDEQPMSSG